MASSDRAWARQAPELARWAWDRYVVRTDVWGGYLPLDARGVQRRRPNGEVYTTGSICTRPPAGRRGAVRLTRAVLEGHFRATAPEHVVGVHTTAPDSRSLFGTIEVDQHGEGGNGPEANLTAALAWYDRAVRAGFHPLLWDSNGKGGYHLDFLLAKPVPTPRLFWFLREFIADHTDHGLPARPETFPKQPSVSPDPAARGHYGNWVRLVGRHHTRDVWARVWDGSAWLSGARAVAHVLSLGGSPAALVPEDAERAGRARAYIRSTPNRGEGGRDDVAFSLLAFLARDLGMPDEEALRWAGEWDTGNSPPKGPDQLREILANVHRYGRNGYGAGLNGAGLNGTAHANSNGAPPPAAVPSIPQAEQQATGSEIILDHFRRRYRPVFRQLGSARCADGRVLSGAEACAVPDSELIARLAGAADAPAFKGGSVNRAALPAFFRSWAKVAWGDLLRSLPEEDNLDPDADPDALEATREEFRRLVAQALLTHVVLGETIGPETEQTRVERRSLIDWCRRFARPGPWRRIRSLQCWCKLVVTGDETQLKVAVRHELFDQLKADRRLVEMGANRFARRAASYGVGCSARGDRPQGYAAVVLADDLVTDLAEFIPDEE